MKQRTTIPSGRESYLWQRFVDVKNRALPEGLAIPESPGEAATLAFRKGLQAGYGEGLVDGVDLGMDIGLSIEGNPQQLDPDILD